MIQILNRRPGDSDCAAYFLQYVRRAQEGDILATLEHQIEETLSLLSGLSEDAARSRYDVGKWSVKEVAGHIADTERIFGYRALCMARGEAASLPGFEQDDYVAHGHIDERPMSEIVDELRLLRASTLSLFRGFSDEAWSREGVADGKPMRVVAIPWIVAGHELHHRGVLRERYGV